MTLHGLKDASADIEQVRSWWTASPEANIGFPIPEGWFVLDVDPRNGGNEGYFAYCEVNPVPPPTLMTSTGGGGSHAFFRGVAAGTQLVKGVDIKRPGGYVILPPSRHISGKRYEWSGSEDTPVAPFTPVFEGVQVDFDIHEGTRHNHMVSFCGRLRAEGLEPPEILERAIPENQENCTPPLPYDEIRTIALSMGRYEKGGGGEKSETTSEEPPTGEEVKPPPPDYPIFTTTDLLAKDLPPIQWFADGLIPDEGAIIIGGSSGIGKSWMLLDLGQEISRGGKWLGEFQTTKGVVLYVDEENGERFMKQRLQMLNAGKQVNPKDVEFYLMCYQGFYFSKDPVQKLERLIQVIKPNVIIMDALIRVHRGDENSAQDMAKIFAVVKSLIIKHKCLFVFADHHRKPGMNQSSGDVMLRGSTEKLAFIDGLISVQKKDGKLLVENSKNRHGRELKPFYVEVVEIDNKEAKVQYAGEAEDLEENTAIAKLEAFLDQVLGDGNWMPRSSLMTMAVQREIGTERTVYRALKKISQNTARYEIREEQGSQGGRPIMFFKLRNSNSN